MRPLRKSLEERLKLNAGGLRRHVVQQKLLRSVTAKRMNLDRIQKVRTIQVRKAVIPRENQILKSYVVPLKQSNFQTTLDLTAVVYLGLFLMRRLCKSLVLKVSEEMSIGITKLLKYKHQAVRP